MNQLKFFSTLILTLFLIQASAHEHHDKAKDETLAPSSESLYNIQSKWQNQNGKEIQLSELKGHPVVISMAYTSCQFSCPLIVEEMKQIETNVKDQSSTLYVLASFDSKRDTPDQLKKFADKHKLDPNHWMLLHGSESSVRQLAATLGIRYKIDSQGEYDHSNLISILDRNGVVQYQQVGINKDRPELEKKLREIGGDSH